MDLLLVREEEKLQIFIQYKVQKNQVQEYVNNIKAWKAKLPHLVGELNDEAIEKLLIKNKFSVERCKMKLENYFTLRGCNIALLQGFENLLPSQQTPTYLPLPQLTPTFERVVITKLLSTDPKNYNLTQTLKFGLAVTELMLQYDGSLGLRFLVDLDGFTVKHLATWNPLLLLKYTQLAEKAYSVRILGIEFINYPKFIKKVFSLLKMALRPKIYERIRLHQDCESLHRVIPKECLPSDYGGCSRNISELLEKWDQEFVNHRNFLANSLKKVAKEELRPVETHKNDLFGVGGTFKKLSLD